MSAGTGSLNPPIAAPLLEVSNVTAFYGDLQALKEVIATLPPMQRDAIQMLKLSEMSLKDAATAGNTTVGALKVATHRAMAALRKMLVKKK